MGWKETCAMEQRWKFIEEVQRGEESVAELCRRYGVSRKTGYKWGRRYESGGMEVLADQSRAALHHPNQISLEAERRVLDLRRKHPHWGPKKLAWKLKQSDLTDTPAVSTIGLMLKRHGLSWARKPKRRATATTSPLAHAVGPNQVWAADYKGWFYCQDGERCYPLTITDSYSRCLLRCQVLERPEGERTRAVFEAAFREYGLPEAIRTDNGTPFSSVGLNGLSRLNVWWMRLGIRLERIEPGQPQQNGRHERMHRTLQAETANPAAATLRRQQARFDAFQREYNRERPHEALGMAVPQDWYASSPRQYPARLPDYGYPARCQTRLVGQDGSIRWNYARLSLTRALQGELVALEEVAEGVWQVRFCQLLLGEFDEPRDGRRKRWRGWLQLRSPSGLPTLQPPAGPGEELLPIRLD